MRLLRDLLDQPELRELGEQFTGDERPDAIVLEIRVESPVRVFVECRSLAHQCRSAAELAVRLESSLLEEIEAELRNAVAVLLEECANAAPADLANRRNAA